MEVISFIILNRSTWRIVNKYFNKTLISRSYERGSEVNVDNFYQMDDSDDDENEAVDIILSLSKCVMDSPKHSGIENKDLIPKDDFEEIVLSSSITRSVEDQDRCLINFCDITFDPNPAVKEVYEELEKVVKLERTVVELETNVIKKDQEIMILKNKLKEEKEVAKVVTELVTTVEKKEQDIVSLKYQLKKQTAENERLKVVNGETNKAPHDSKVQEKHPSLLDLHSEKVFIHKDLAGAIIGPFGSRIRAIRSNSNATIVISEEIMGNSKRTITITGTAEQIENAKDLLNKSAREHTVC